MLKLNFGRWPQQDKTFFTYKRLYCFGCWTPLIRAWKRYHGAPILEEMK